MSCSRHQSKDCLQPLEEITLEQIFHCSLCKINPPRAGMYSLKELYLWETCAGEELS